MEIINLICNGSAVLFLGVVLIAMFATFCASIYSCFSKKIEGKLPAKIVVAITIGCICPWILKLLIIMIGRLV